MEHSDSIFFFCLMCAMIFYITESNASSPLNAPHVTPTESNINICTLFCVYGDVGVHGEYVDIKSWYIITTIINLLINIIFFI